MAGPSFVSCNSCPGDSPVLHSTTRQPWSLRGHLFMYRNLHLFQEEKRWFSPGERFKLEFVPCTLTCGLPANRSLCSFTSGCLMVIPTDRFSRSPMRTFSSALPTLPNPLGSRGSGYAGAGCWPPGRAAAEKYPHDNLDTLLYTILQEHRGRQVSFLPSGHMKNGGHLW